MLRELRSNDSPKSFSNSGRIQERIQLFTININHLYNLIIHKTTINTFLEFPSVHPLVQNIVGMNNNIAKKKV